MKTFDITFEVLGSVVLSIEAQTIDEAKIIADNMKNQTKIMGEK